MQLIARKAILIDFKPYDKYSGFDDLTSVPIWFFGCFPTNSKLLLILGAFDRDDYIATILPHIVLFSLV